MDSQKRSIARRTALVYASTLGLGVAAARAARSDDKQSVAETVARLLKDKKADFITSADLGVLPDKANGLAAAFATATAAGKAFVLLPGEYLLSDHVPVVSGLRAIWMPGARLKLTGQTKVGGFLTGQYEGRKPKPVSDVELYGPVVDCNRMPGENAIAMAAVQDIRIFDPQVFNAVHSPKTLGGRAFQFEGGDTGNIQVTNAQIHDCSIGINSHADSAGGTQKARNINYRGVVMRNVDIPFNIDAQYANPQKGMPENMSSHASDVELFNCGKITWPDNAGELGGGIVCGDRGYGLKINRMRIVNDAAYGRIGGLTRGIIYGVELNDVTFSGPGATAVFNANVCGFGHPGSAILSVIDARNVRILSGQFDYIVSSTKNGLGASRLQCAIAGATAAKLTGLVDAEAARAKMSVADFRNLDDGRSTGLMPLRDIEVSGNTLAAAASRRNGFRER